MRDLNECIYAIPDIDQHYLIALLDGFKSFSFGSKKSKIIWHSEITVGKRTSAYSEQNILKMQKIILFIRILQADMRILTGKIYLAIVVDLLHTIYCDSPYLTSAKENLSFKREKQKFACKRTFCQQPESILYQLRMHYEQNTDITVRKSGIEKIYVNGIIFKNKKKT